MLDSVSWMQDQIQRTNRNYDTNTGKESARITTASGLLQLRTDAESQQKLKKADRNAGFERLYELLDYLALEFFDEDRMLYIGAKKKGEEPQMLRFNRENYAMRTPGVVDPVSGEVLMEESTYFPRVDVTVTAGDGLSRSPADTLQVLDKLAATQVTPDNWKLLAEELEYLDIPQKQEIIDGWKRKFEPVVPPEIIQALEEDPALLEAVGDAVLAKLDAEIAAGEQPISQPGTDGPAVGGNPSVSFADSSPYTGEPLGVGGQSMGLPVM